MWRTYYFIIGEYPDIMDGLTAWADQGFTGRDLIIIVSASNGRFLNSRYWIIKPFQCHVSGMLVSTEYRLSWQLKKSIKIFQSHFSPITKHFVNRNSLYYLNLHNLMITREYTSNKFNGCIISKMKSIKLPNRCNQAGIIILLE